MNSLELVQKVSSIYIMLGIFRFIIGLPRKITPFEVRDYINRNRTIEWQGKGR